MCFYMQTLKTIKNQLILNNTKDSDMKFYQIILGYVIKAPNRNMN